MTGRRGGVSLAGIAAGALAGAALLTGIVALADGLRHPEPAEPPPSAAGDASVVEEPPPTDPRIELECPSPRPREGEPRGGPLVIGADPAPVSARDLRECPQTYDGALVSYEGEAVGALLPRRAGAWVRLNDDPYASEPGPLPGHRDYLGSNEGVAVLLPHDIADRVRNVGGPGRRGDVVAVTGVFHRVDERTGEVAVIRARAGDVSRPGTEVGDPPLPGRERAAALLAVLAVTAIAGERLHARRWSRA